MYHSDFVHLHVHTQYSLLDGACRINELTKKAAEYRMPALAMTDHGNIFGALSFYQAAIKAGVKPIIGCEVYTTPGSRHEKKPGDQRRTNHLCLYAKDEKGYQNLTKIVSFGYLEGFYYRPRVDKEILSQYSEGILASSACLKGSVATALRQDKFDEARHAADELRQIFGKGNFYLEMMDHGLQEQKIVNEGIMKLAVDLKLPIIATNDVHYLNQEHAQAHEALLCIGTQTTLDDPRRMKMTSDQFYLKSPEEMKQLFDWCPAAISNTLEVAEKCNLQLEFGKFHLPRYDPPGGQSKEEFFKELCLQGVKERYGKMTPEIKERLEHEFRTIKRMGFISYFLIVWDFIHYAKQRGIPVGPGRGSAAGSLVSYLIGITNLDPLKYGLLFERFLNPDRATMPDVDIDFCFERRPEVIEYVTNKYGKDNVAQIITFGTMQAKAAVRDVGRVMNVPYGDVDRIAKLIPNELGITIKEGLEKEPELKKLIKEDRTANDVISMAQTLEGITRHASIHAAGVVISDKPLTEYVPLYKTSDGQVTTGFAMKGVEQMGLLKMDFLGLRTLTVVSQTVEIIKRTKKKSIDIDAIPLNDSKTFALLSRAKSFGIFQLESAGMRDLLKKSKPNQFEDLITILALYRPGPMGSGMLDDYIKRKKGEIPVKYDHPKLESILKETYGIIVFQEQVMQMASMLAGFSMVQADHLRRAMSKKIPEVMDQMRRDFEKGCQETSQIGSDQANKLFDLIEYFSGYGFNRSHSAAYALISYQTAYLKANYPVEFMCALLTSEKDNTDKVVEYVRECEAIGLKVLPPNVNESYKEFYVVDNQTISFGLLAVKNVGASAIDSIVLHRKEEPYTSIYDFCKRVDPRLVNRKVLESLIRCGAMDGFGVYRSKMNAVIEQALDLGAKTQKEKASGQFSFFEMDGGMESFQKEVETYPNIEEWPQMQKLSLEKELLGFYVSGHPLAHYQLEIKEFTDYTTNDLKSAVEGQEIKMVGMLNVVKLATTRRTGERMAILQLEDIFGQVEVVIFPSTYPNVAQYLREGGVVVVVGKVSHRDEDPKIIGQEVKPVEDVYQLIKSVNVDLSGVNGDKLNDLRSRLSKFPGKVPVYLKMDTEAYKSVEILVGEDLFIAPCKNLFEDIKGVVGEDRFSMKI